MPRGPAVGVVCPFAWMNALMCTEGPTVPPCAPGGPPTVVREHTRSPSTGGLVFRRFQAVLRSVAPSVTSGPSCTNGCPPAVTGRAIVVHRPSNGHGAGPANADGYAIADANTDAGTHGKGGRGKHSEGQVVDGLWTEVCGQQTQANNPSNNQHNPQYANYRAPLTRKRHTMPHSAQPRHTNDWAPRTRKRHQREHRPQRPTERSDPTQHAKGRTGDCPGPRKGTATRRTVTRGGGEDAARTTFADLTSASNPPVGPPFSRRQILLMWGGGRPGP